MKRAKKVGTVVGEHPFEDVVFSGGGAKGAVYSGVLQSLMDLGILTGVQNLAGSSAGALAAFLGAMDPDPEEIRRIFSETNFKKLLGKGFITKDGKPLNSLIKKIASEKVANFLVDDQIPACHERIGELDAQIRSLEISKADENERIKTLTEQRDILQSIINDGGTKLDELKARAQRGGPILFEDLGVLQVVAPDRFKGLVVTATNKSTGALVLFNIKDTPKTEIADSCSASAALPLVLDPVEIDGQKYVDGGYRDNVPQRQFSNSKGQGIKDLSNSPEQCKEAQRKGETLALVFGGDDIDSDTSRAIYSAQERITHPGKAYKFLVDVMFKALNRVGGWFVYTEEHERTMQELRKNDHNVVLLGTGSVGTLSFNDAQKKAAYLHIKGKLTTDRYLADRMITPHPDPCLELKGFMLLIYENREKGRGPLKKLKNTVIGQDQEKQDLLLSFCKDHTWNKMSPEKIVESFVGLSGWERHSNKCSTKTHTIEILVKALNDPTTPDKVKEAFLQAAKIDITKTPGYKAEEPRSKNLVRFQFHPSDFNEITTRHTRLLAVHSKHIVPSVKPSNWKRKVTMNQDVVNRPKTVVEYFGQQLGEPPPETKFIKKTSLNRGPFAGR